MLLQEKTVGFNEVSIILEICSCICQIEDKEHVENQLHHIENVYASVCFVATKCIREH